MASMLSKRQQGNLPSTLTINPSKGKEHCKSIILRSDKVLEALKKTNKDEDKEASPTQATTREKVKDNLEAQPRSPTLAPSKTRS